MRSKILKQNSNEEEEDQIFANTLNPYNRVCKDLLDNVLRK
jgi:hypothetical protein